MDPRDEMDRMYRVQRHFYDVTREYYLLGRDRLLREMQIREGDNVLEVACGTARNLIAAAALQPKAHYYGLDASNAMLKTAAAKIAKSRHAGKIVLKQCLAEEFTYKDTFGLNRPFDSIFFSYGLSMIPAWPQAIEVALQNLRPGGSLYIVDFWDQQELPAVFRIMLARWLAAFGVIHRPELLTHLRELGANGTGELSIQSIRRRYAYLAHFIKAQQETLSGRVQSTSTREPINGLVVASNLLH